MILKFFILAFLGLLSTVSPPVFAGIVLVALISMTIYNFDASLVKFSKTLAKKTVAKPRKIPCSFLAIGLLFAGAFSLIGFAWGANPSYAEDTLETLRMCASIGLHLGSLMIMVCSMSKFVKLVD